MPTRPLQPLQKACACLADAAGLLLVFRHPKDGDLQLPKGTVEPGECTQDAVRRELLEESGIDYQGALQALGSIDRYGEDRSEGKQHRHPQQWHLFLMRAERPLPERFEHIASGSPEEEGLRFSFSWLAPEAPLVDFAAPYARAITRAREALASRTSGLRTPPLSSD